MIFGILVVMQAVVATSVFLWFGVPIPPLLVASAIIQSAVVYRLTNNMTCLKLGFGCILVACAQYLILPILLAQTPKTDDLAAPLNALVPLATTATWFSAVVTFVCVTLIGMACGINPTTTETKSE